MEILTHPNVILSSKAQEVTDFSGMYYFTGEIIQAAEDAGLVGLAANQVNYLVRVFVVSFGSAIPVKKRGENWTPDWQIFINPTIKYLDQFGKSWDYEGCGSIPKRQALVERHNKIIITAQDVNGDSFTHTLSGKIARICQHENDHLNGVLLVNKKVRAWQQVG